MAEQPQAQSKLGQLFVDLGVTGVGKTLKSLNSVAATFLLGKNAANQFANTIVTPFKEAGKGAVEINKMANALGATTKEYQKLSMYFKQNGVEGLLGDIEKVIQTIQDFNDYGGSVPQGWAFVQGKINNGAALFEDLTGDLEGALTFYDRLKAGLEGLSEAEKIQLLRYTNSSSDWNYLWSKGKSARDYYTISDEALRKNTELDQSFQELATTTENFLSELKSNISPALTKIANFLTRAEQGFNVNDPKRTGALGLATAGGVGMGAGVGAFLGPLGVLGGAVIGGAGGFASGLWADQQGKKMHQTSQGKPNDVPLEIITGMAADIGYMGDLPDIASGAGLPPNLSGMVQNITNNITHDITINSNDPSETANQIAGISAQDIQYTTYQAANLAGL